MAEGKHCIMRLNEAEYKAALAAIKLVRGDEIKNAYKEGWQDGWNECSKAFKGMRVDGDGWDRSHAKALSESKGEK